MLFIYNNMINWPKLLFPPINLYSFPIQDKHMNTKILILDTETTGKTNPVPIEVAYMELDYPSLKVLSSFEKRYNPEKPIELGAMATHHIMNEDVADCEPFNNFNLPEGTTYLIGHNIDYDWKALNEPNVKRICTLALARFLIPDLDSYSQSALLYYIMGSDAKEHLKNAHSALADIKICLNILCCLLQEAQKQLYQVSTIEELYELSEKARIPTKMSFGKHEGEFIKDLPYSYKTWMLKQTDMDPYLLKAVRDSLNG
jgi:exodeoxyribonuclease X